MIIRFWRHAKSYSKVHDLHVMILHPTAFLNQLYSFHFHFVGWCYLNIDGFVVNQLNAACGGLIKDKIGTYVGGFASNLKTASIPTIELMGIMHGTELAGHGCPAAPLLMWILSVC